MYCKNQLSLTDECCEALIEALVETTKAYYQTYSFIEIQKMDRIHDNCGYHEGACHYVRLDLIDFTQAPQGIPWLDKIYIDYLQYFLDGYIDCALDYVDWLKIHQYLPKNNKWLQFNGRK